MINLHFPHECTIDSRLCFVLMPFDVALESLYDTVEQTLQDYCGIKCLRADKMNRPSYITDDIWRKICESRFLIADLTGRNPNVYYELGIAHALGKNVILMTQDLKTLPFDIKGLRTIEYAPNFNPRMLKQDLVKYVRDCIETISPSLYQGIPVPIFHDPYFSGGLPDLGVPRVKLTHLLVPRSVPLGQPFNITLKARNMGSSVRQGYFSVSFPDGVEDLRIVKSSTDSKIGLKDESWANGRVTLSYPIAEGYKWDAQALLWESLSEYYITVQGIAKRKGFMWFYVSASTYDQSGKKWIFDPEQSPLDIDQRGENVYCGVIEVT